MSFKDRDFLEAVRRATAASIPTIRGLMDAAPRGLSFHGIMIAPTPTTLHIILDRSRRLRHPDEYVDDPRAAEDAEESRRVCKEALRVVRELLREAGLGAIDVSYSAEISGRDVEWVHRA